MSELSTSSNVGDDDQQPVAKGIVQASELPVFNAQWREEEDILIAIEMSIHEQQLQITAEEKAAIEIRQCLVCEILH